MSHINHIIGHMSSDVSLYRGYSSKYCLAQAIRDSQDMPVVLRKVGDLTMQSILAMRELRNTPSLATVVDILNEVQTIKCFEPDEAIKAALSLARKVSTFPLRAAMRPVRSHVGYE